MKNLLLTLLVLTSISLEAQTTYTNSESGNWTGCYDDYINPVWDNFNCPGATVEPTSAAPQDIITIIISGSVIIDSAINIKGANLIITNTGSLTITDSGSLTISNKLFPFFNITKQGTLDNSGTLIIEDFGSLIIDEATDTSNNANLNLSDNGSLIVTNAGILTNNGTISGLYGNNSNAFVSIENAGVLNNNAILDLFYFYDFDDETLTLTVKSSGIINNNNTGTLDIDNEGVININDGGTFNNSGIITSNATEQINIQSLGVLNILESSFLNLINFGTINIKDSSTLSFGVLDNNGTLNIEDSATLNIANAAGLNNYGTINNHGVFTQDNGGTLNISSGATLNIHDNAVFNSLSNSEIINKGTISISTLGTMTINDSSKIIFNEVFQEPTINISGTFNLLSPSFPSGPLNGVINVNPTGVFNVGSSGYLVIPTVNNNGLMNITGELDISNLDNIGTLIINSNGILNGYDTIDNSGTITINNNATFGNSGILNNLGILDNLGTLSGINTSHSGSFSNDGILSPGIYYAPTSTIGTYTFNDDYTHQTGATLEFQLGSSTDFDEVIVGGAANLDGALNVTLLNGYTPTISDSFTILTANTISGAFATTNLPAGYTWNINYTATTVTLEVAATLSSPIFNIEDVIVFPNPASNQITISGVNQTEFVEIYNITGQKTLETKVNTNNNTINVSNFSNGMYFLKIKDTTFKFIKN